MGFISELEQQQQRQEREIDSSISLPVLRLHAVLEEGERESKREELEGRKHARVSSQKNNRRRNNE